jgi:hypothetical protein
MERPGTSEMWALVQEEMKRPEMTLRIQKVWMRVCLMEVLVREVQGREKLNILGDWEDVELEEGLLGISSSSEVGRSGEFCSSRGDEVVWYDWRRVSSAMSIPPRNSTA